MRSIISASFKSGIAVALLALAAPGQVLAQSCNADVSIAPANINAPLLLGAPVSLVARVGAGIVQDFDFPPDNEGYLDISQFEFKLDCNLGETFDACSDAGNEVVFLGVTDTDCTDQDDQPVTFTVTPSVDDDNILIFSPGPDTVIRNWHNTTCSVEFGVQVDSILAGNDQQVVEMVGWLNTEETFGVCSNGEAADATAAILLPFNVTSTFRVTKDFLDDNPDPVDVHISCDTGLPLQQSFTISDDTEVNFVVKHFWPGELDCTVWEEAVDGYTPTYVASAEGGVGIPSHDIDGCYFNEVENGGFLCAITNSADPGTFTVDKEWVLGEAEDEDIVLEADVTIECESVILEDDVMGGQGLWYVERELIGMYDSETVDVDTTGGPTRCRAFEGVLPSGIEVSNGCEDWMDVDSGGDTSCTIVNTRFFEGIPTLSQYGMAILVLLTLGVGLVGFRRFA
jgi:hypothetical protein